MRVRFPPNPLAPTSGVGARLALAGAALALVWLAVVWALGGDGV